MSVFDDLQRPPQEPNSDRWLSPDAVIATMAEEGDPVPSGWAPLDNRLRRGGLTPGRVLAVGGPPFAGKTTIVVDIALSLSQHVPVFALFSDEGRAQAAVRIGVMLGVPLDRIEEKPREAAQLVKDFLGERSIYLLQPDDDTSTAEDVYDYALKHVPRGTTAAIILDSVQTIAASQRTASRNGSEREGIKDFMKIVRDRSTADGRISVITSQSNRASYRHRNAEENSVAIASFSGSASIEFMADAGIVLSLPNDDSEIVKVEVVKNRLGHFTKRLSKVFHIRFDMNTGRMLEVDDSERDNANAQARRTRLKPVMDAIVKELATVSEASGAHLERKMRGRGKGFGSASVRAALDALEADSMVTVLFREGKSGGYFYALKYGPRPTSPPTSSGDVQSNLAAPLVERRG